MLQADSGEVWKLKNEKCPTVHACTNGDVDEDEDEGGGVGKNRGVTNVVRGKRCLAVA